MKLRERFQKAMLGGGQEKEIPKDFNCRLIYLIRYHYLQLIGLNFLFVISSLGGITIPAAASAMHSVISRITTEQAFSFREAYWKEFKTSFLQRAVLSALLAIVPFSLSFYTTWMGLDRDGTVIRLICGVVLFLLGSYWFACMALIDTTPLKNLRNAAILMAVYWKKSLCILISSGVLCGACFLFPLQGIPVMLICLFSLSALINMLLLREPILKELSLPENEG